MTASPRTTAGSFPVSIRSGIDAAVAVAVNTAEVALGAPIEIYVDVSSLRALPLTNAVLSVNFNEPVTAANMPGATCNASAFAVTCTIATLPAGATRRLTLNATASTAGPMFAGASINAGGDGDFSNNTANLTGWVRAEHDIDLAAGAPSIDLGVGAYYEIPYTLRSRGTFDATNTRLTITLLSTAVAVQTHRAWRTCEQSGPMTLPVRARRGTRRAKPAWCCCASMARAPPMRTSAPSPASMTMSYTTNNIAGVQLRVDHAVDLAVVLASGGAGVEDLPIDGQVTLRSNGRQTLTGASFDIDLTAAGTLESASIYNGAACTLLDGQRARCTLPAWRAMRSCS